jgi:hypothetical protein
MDSLRHETPPKGFFAHNAALARNIVGQAEMAEKLLDAALQKGFDADETKRLRTSLYVRKGAMAEAIGLADTLSDRPQNQIIRADLRLKSAPAEARAILAGRVAFKDRRDTIAAALVFVDSLLAEGKYEDALAEVERLQHILPNDPQSALLAYRVKSAQGDPNAEHALDEAIGRVTDVTDFVTRYLVADALAKAGRNDDAVDLLYRFTATTFDSPALRTLVAAAANADRRSILKELLDQLPPNVRELPFYRRGRIALAIRTGDVGAAEQEIRRYLALRPRNLELHLQLLHALFRQDKLDALRQEVSKPATSFDGAPEDFVKLAQFKDTFGDWQEAYGLAYATLLAHPNSPAVSMGYIGMLLRPSPSKGLDLSPAVVTQDMAVGLLKDDGNKVTFVLEPVVALRPTHEYLAPDHQIAECLLGQPVGSDVHLPDGTTAKIGWIKPKVLHALHELLENFNNFFPGAEGFEKVRLKPGHQGGLQPMLDRVRERHDAIEAVSKLYDAGTLPLALTARALGSTPLETFLGLIASGHRIRVCEGTLPERNLATGAIIENQAKGCVLDEITLHVVRRLKLERAVIAVCGPIGILERTALRVQQQVFDLEENIDTPDMSLLFRDGQYYRNEVTSEQKHEALKALQEDKKWIADNTATLPAQGTKDPGPQLRTLIKRFGSEFVDDILAAEGTGRLLVCEDQLFRVIAQSEFGVKATWLQPILMKARAENIITAEDYQRAILGFIESRFEFVSIDGSVLLQSLAGRSSHDLPKEFATLAGRLGGAKAEIKSHLDVAFHAIIGTWHDEKRSRTLREAIVGTLLENICKERPLDHVAAIMQGMEEIRTDGSEGPGICSVPPGLVAGSLHSFPQPHHAATDRMKTLGFRWRYPGLVFAELGD